MIESKVKVSKAIDRSQELIEKFRRDCTIRGMTPGSVVRYVSTLRIFNGFLQAKGLDLTQVDGIVLRNWLEYLSPRLLLPDKVIPVPGLI